MRESTEEDAKANRYVHGSEEEDEEADAESVCFDLVKQPWFDDWLRALTAT